MARILYAVMGNTHGHSMRSLSIARQLSEHEFYFVGGGRVPLAVNGRYPVLEIPVLRTIHKNQKLSVRGTFYQIILRVLQIPQICLRIHKLVKTWKPDLIITDREFFTPIYAMLAGRSCLSINHNSVLKALNYQVPSNLRMMHYLNLLNDYTLFHFTKRNLIVSFFSPPIKKGTNYEIFPAVVRPEVEDIEPSNGKNIFVYLTTPNFPELIKTLKQLSRPVMMYGSELKGKDGNITFRPYNQKQILIDLASSAYAVVNGGHNVISEALFYGKPILCFPIKGLVEQWINVYYAKKLMYGDYSYDKSPQPEIFERFERRLEYYRQAITKGFINGGPIIANRLREIIKEPNQ